MTKYQLNQLYNINILKKNMKVNKKNSAPFIVGEMRKF